MKVTEHFEQFGSRGFYRPVAQVSFEQAIEMIADGIRTARELGLADLLANSTGLTGFTPPSVFARHTMAVKWAQSAGSVAACRPGGAPRADRSAEDRRADVPEPRRHWRRVHQRSRRARLARRAARPGAAHAQLSQSLAHRRLTHCARRCDARACAHELPHCPPATSPPGCTPCAAPWPAAPACRWPAATASAAALRPTSSRCARSESRSAAPHWHGAPDPGARASRGTWLMGYDAQGHCPMFAPAAALSTRIVPTPAGPTTAASSLPPA